MGKLVQLKLSDVDFDSKSTRIKIRAETTKIREPREIFLTTESTNSLKDYLTRYFDWKENDFDFEDESKLFSCSSRVVQNNFEKASETINFKLKPHTLRTVFTEKYTQAGIKDKYIDVFCGRISKSVLSKNYTDYSPSSLIREYDNLEDSLTFESFSFSWN